MHRRESALLKEVDELRFAASEAAAKLKEQVRAAQRRWHSGGTAAAVVAQRWRWWHSGGTAAAVVAHLWLASAGCQCAFSLAEV